MLKDKNKKVTSKNKRRQARPQINKMFASERKNLMSEYLSKASMILNNLYICT